MLDNRTIMQSDDDRVGVDVPFAILDSLQDLDLFAVSLRVHASLNLGTLRIFNDTL